MLTREQHECLHHDALLKKLTQDAPSLSDYRQALQVFYALFSAVEVSRSRLGCWPMLSLAQECDALRDDGIELPPSPVLRLKNDLAALGALYVAHGSAFGRQAMRRHIALVLPTAPTRYLTLPRRHQVWRDITHQLNRIGTQEENFGTILDAAALTFRETARLSQLLRANDRTS